MSSRSAKRSTDLFREMRGKLHLLREEVGSERRIDGWITSVIDEIDAIAAELEARTIERAHKRKRGAAAYAEKHPGKRARW